MYVDGKFALGLSLNQIADLGIKNGQEISEAELKVLQKHSDMGKAYARTLDWLLRRPHSRRELYNRLYNLKYDDEEKDYIVARVERYLDDEAFARFWVECRRGSKAKSARVIRGELAQKGVAKEIIDKVLVENEATDQDMLKKLITKKSRQTKYQDTQKLIEYLLRQGFSYDDIKKCLDDIRPE